MNDVREQDQAVIAGGQQSGADTTMSTQPQTAVPLVEPPLTVAPPVLPPDVSVHQPQVADNPQAGPSADSAQTAMPETPVEAADNDVIEKEWVIRAKQVVAENRDDPFRQVQAINRIKADYMKKRYDKDIKIADA